jgi:disulfide bond formation protein DsbB
MQPTSRPAPQYITPPAYEGNTTVAWTVLALIAALVTVAGTVALSLDVDLPPVNIGDRQVSLTKNLKACPLCFYQRTFAFGTLGVLLIGLLTRARRTGAVGVMALPLAIGGVSIAGFHAWLEYDKKLECPLGLADIGTAPQQALVALGIVALLLLIDSFRNSAGGSFGAPTVLLAIILGGAAAFGCIKTVPPLPAAPTQPYDAEKQPLDMCRPPYKAPEPQS